MDSAYPFRKQLLQDKDEVNFFLNLCDMYKNKDTQYYNLPLPNDIYEKFENGLNPNRYNNINNLKKYKDELEFYRWVATEYDKNCFIITDYHFNRGLHNDDDIIKFYLVDTRETVHEICDFIEKRIDILKKSQDSTNTVN